MRISVRHFVGLLLLSAAFAASPTHATDPLTTTGSIKLALQQVQEILSKLLIGADAVLASKIEAASNEAGILLKRAGELEKQGNHDANELVNEVVRPLSQLMPQVREIVNSTERRTFLDLNVSMAGLMQTVDALPLTKVGPFVAAVNPTRIYSSLTDRQVTVYGWFGKPNRKYPVRARVAGKSVAIRRVPGGYAFEIPAGTQLVEEKYLPLEFDVPDATDLILFDWTSYLTITDRIYVQKSEPYGCQYVAYIPNPGYQATVDADQTFHDDARTEDHGGRPTQHRTVAASDLFIATVSSSALFEPSTAKILEPRPNIYGAAACPEHANWSGKVVRWNTDLIEYQLNAPEIGPHQHSGTRLEDIKVLGVVVGKTDVPYFYIHGGGGSHADIELRPQFSVVRKGASAVLQQPAVPFRLRISETAEFPLTFAADTWKVHARCVYKDGDETFDTGVMVLNAGDPEEAGREISARFADGKLYVQSLR